MNKHILVVTSCTGEKLYDPCNKLTVEDFNNARQFKKREKELAKFRADAGKMYTGKQHIALMEGVKDYRDRGGVIDVDIMSAGYGMLRETDSIVPYEVTFSKMKKTDLRLTSKYLGITSKLQGRILSYDLIFFLLGDNYLDAIEWPLFTRKDQRIIFFAGDSAKYKILFKPNNYLFSAGKREAKVFHSGLIEIKGRLFAMLLQQLKHKLCLWDEIYQKPSIIRELIIQELSECKQVSLFEQTSCLNEELLPYYNIDIPENHIAPNYGREFKYYMPENDDRVDPKYNFLTDKTNRVGGPLSHDFYAHQLHGAPQYDGILISKINIDGASQKKNEMVHEMGIRNFLRLPSDYPIMGDCGAFSYIDEEEPPYTTNEVLEYYHSLGFNYGVSVYHLIVGPYRQDEKERERRYKLTLDNARDFINKYNQNESYSFIPIGIAQGWDPISFREAVKALINMGYNHVALGGLAKEKSFDILKILKEIAPIIPNDRFRMHLFGVVRDNMEYMKVFHKLGVTSFDSASPLRRAWLGSNHNYYSTQKHYAAIRIPEPSTSLRVKQQIKDYLGSIQFGTKYNYRVLGEFFKKSYRKSFKRPFKEVLSDTPGDMDDYVNSFNEKNDTDMISLLFEIFNIKCASGTYEMLELAYTNYSKYLSFEEFFFKKLKEYNADRLGIASCISQIVQKVKKIGLTENSPKVYEHAFAMFDQFKKFEKTALKAIRDYDKGDLDIESTLNMVLEYDEKLGENRENHASQYREVLFDKPWKKCDCNICKDIGVDVVIFRGNNRNRRRGFHNTYVFYNRICQLKEDIFYESQIQSNSSDKIKVEQEKPFGIIALKERVTN